ncbi:MAG: hypothetical protein QW484_02750 [Candidatus Pacearchaeota archaeon]
MKGKKELKDTKSNENKVNLPSISLLFFLFSIAILITFSGETFFISTGKVIDKIELAKTEYGVNENFDGNLNIILNQGDHIPASTKVYFLINGENYSYNITATLPGIIALSSSPWSGNFSYGKFNNVDGPSPSGEGWGFGACPQISIPPPQTPPISTEAITQPQTPIQGVDLIVSDVYVVYGRLYAKIKNIGNEPTPDFPFSVKACWYRTEDCFFEQIINTVILPSQEIILDMNYQNVEGKSVQVIVDFYDDILEINEFNNEFIKDFGFSQGCVDTDNGKDIFSFGECISGIIPVFMSDECLDDKKIKEWFCDLGGCNYEIFECPSDYFCDKEKKACVSKQQIPSCKDSDGGKNYWVKGTCKDDYEERTDYCLEIGNSNEPNLAEFYCTGNNLIYYDSECSECGEVYCAYEGTRSQGWYAKCPKGEKLISYDSLCHLSTRRKFKPVCLFNESKSEGWYTPNVCDIDQYFCYYGCSAGSCKTSNYSCDGWNNIYKINLKNLYPSLKTPAPRGNYDFSVKLVYEETILPEPIVLTSDVKKFSVISHKACQNYQCMWVSGSGNDQCNVDSDCRPSGGGGGGGGGGVCNELWQFSSWSDCIEGKKTRECFDIRNCGTTYAKPTYCLPLGNKYIQTEECIPGCQENWHCSDWSYCNEETKEQSSICEDLNKCNSFNFTYIQLRDCCIEDWQCKWGPCINGRQEKVCIDLNNCGTEFNKPRETRICKKGLSLISLTILILIFIIIILLILYSTKILKWPFKRKLKTIEEESTEEATFKEIKI